MDNQYTILVETPVLFERIQMMFSGIYSADAASGTQLNCFERAMTRERKLTIHTRTAITSDADMMPV